MDSTPQETQPFAVLLAKPSSPEPQKIGAVLADFQGIPFADAARRARACWGIVAESLDEIRARDLAARLEGAGLSARAVRQNALAELPPLIAVRKAALDKAGISMKSAGAPERVSGQRIGLIAAACLQQKTRTKIMVEEGPSAGRKALNMGIMMATGLPIGLGKGRQKVEKVREDWEQRFYLDVFLKEPALRLRVDGQDFDYSYLGKRMSYATWINFKLLVADAVETNPRALLNHGAHILQKNLPVNSMGYDGIADMERESRWLLTTQILSD